MTFDEMLAKALEESFDERMQRRMTVEKKHRFSLAYRLWEYRTLRELKKKHSVKHWTLRKARYAVMIMIIACSLLLGATAYAVGTAIARYTVDTKPISSKLFFENLSSDKQYLEEFYEPTLNGGWEIDTRYSDNMGMFVKYKRGENELVFSQNVIWGNTLDYNTQNTVIEAASVFEENDGFFISFKNKEESGLYWIYNGYLFILFGDLDKNEAVNWARSIKIQ